MYAKERELLENFRNFKNDSEAIKSNSWTQPHGWQKDLPLWRQDLSEELNLEHAALVRGERGGNLSLARWGFPAVKCEGLKSFSW